MTSNGSSWDEVYGALGSERTRELKSLCPSYDSDQHGAYVKALNSAVLQRGVTNIALSGPYGVGKSSILQGFRKYHPDAIFISLSTLGFIKPTESKSTQSSDGAISPQTNQIQKEIVKQLLYRKPPSELPASRFKRIQKPDLRQSLTVSALIGFVATIIIAAIGGFAKIPKVCNSAWWEFGVKFVGVWLLLSLVAQLAGQFLRGAVHLDKFTAGPATLTLSQESDSYFDRYLDEIIYFFEMTACRIVVFEDIDRFGNWEIFEELRELNTLLNNAEQVRDKNSESSKKKVVFIYAMKDSIFEPPAVADTDEAAKDNQDRTIQEIQRANRTKFFDVIIPVVPFVTHRSARDLMRKELNGVSPKVSGELIDRVAKYVPDFRLLRSACNEYTIYAQFVLGDDALKLDPDKLFALMLYKSIHLQDFERIHLGQSKLDDIYQMSVRAKEDCIRTINDKYDALEKRLESSAEAGNIHERASKLRKMVEWVAARSSQKVDSISMEVNNIEYSEDEIKEFPFWDTLSRISNTQPIIVRYQYVSYSNQVAVLYFNKTEMEEFAGKGIFAAPINSKIRNDIDSNLIELERSREHYRLATMADLMSDSSATVTSARTSETYSFAKYVNKLLGSELAAALIRYGYIDRNFVLYTSTYHTTFLSANAMTFRLQHMERGVMNTNYKLSDDDVIQLISDTTIDLEEFARPGAYNVSILDYLLSNRNKYRKRLDAMELSFLQGNGSTTLFLQSFFSSDSLNKDRLINELTPQYPGIFTLLVGLRGVPDEKQVNYVNFALQCASQDVDYDTSTLRSFVEASYGNMTVFTSTHADKPVDTVAILMARAGAKFADTTVIETDVRERLIRNNCYEVNRQNLDTVSGDHQPALDVLYGKKPTVYAYLLQSLEAYLAIIAEDESDESSALVGSADTAKVIADVVKLDVAASTRPRDSASDDAKLGDSEAFPLLSSLLGASGGDWSIDLDSLPSGCWPMLAAHERLGMTTSNLLKYINKHGVDDDLVGQLKCHVTIEHGSINLSDDEYIELAVAILGINDEQIPVERRVALVVSIGGGPIPTYCVTPQEGELVGRLIEANLIEDSSDAYRLVLNLDWPSREFAIASSRRFADYMDTSLVGNDALAIVQSRSVPVKVKQNIINSISPYCYGMDVEDLASLVECVASQQDLTVDGNALIWLLNQGVKSNVVVSLLVTGLDSLSDSDVRDIVTALGQPYSDLLNKGRTQVRVDTIEGVDRLLERLKIVGEVTKYVKDGGRSQYIIHRHR